MQADIVIIGAGAAGVLVATHLLRAGHAGRLTLIEQGAALGEGVAYATRRAEHRLNVVASRMSAFDDDPSHFVRYLVAEGRAVDAASATTLFARRDDFARYLRATFDAARAGSARVEVINDAAIGIAVHDDLRVQRRDGGEIRADAVVLALGNRPRGLDALLDAAVPRDRLVAGWDSDAVAALGRDETLCIAGTGLSMIDVLLTLRAQGHRGAIHALSGHALLPLPHAVPGRVDFDLQAYLQAPLRTRMRLLRHAAAKAQASGQPWQWLMDTLRAHNAQAWQTLSDADQRRFRRHVARTWSVHRHRIPADAARVIDAMLAEGACVLQRGRLRAVRWQAGRLAIDAGAESLVADRLIDCTGIESDWLRDPGPLLASLRDAGHVQRGAHGMGLATDAHGALIGTSGTPNPRLVTLGSARAGQLWESVAVPELRTQAAALAHVLTQQRG